MNWSNVILILNREIRDQLRDRRTLFMIFVLPILLYPFMGMTFFQLAQFAQEHPTRVFLIGQEQLPEEPALTEMVGEEGSRVLRFAKIEEEFNPHLLELHAPPKAATSREEREGQLAAAKEGLKDGTYDAIIYFPPDFSQQLQQFRQRVVKNKAAEKRAVPQPEIFHNTAKKQSTICYGRVRRVLSAWRDALVKQNLIAAGLPEAAAMPFRTKLHDVADESNRFASAWSVVFPFLMLIWSLTGAFYPAIDLCAGEKERGTLETLLSSPAGRGEIVWGKLITIMLFSMATVLLNILAVGATGWLIISRLQLPEAAALGPPPLLAFLWVLLAAVPISALFSALCLALAAFARSNKEGQYYLMPLFLVTLPLVIMPMWPNFELNLGNSLIPLTGIVLVLKAAIEGDYAESLRYLLPVAVVTAVCCLLAVRWAIDQFNKESVLFRESERFDLGLWLRHLVRDRRDTPPVAAAVMCGVLILTVNFFMQLAMAGSTASPAVLHVTLQLTAVLTPAVLMTVILARSPRQTLSLRMPPLWTVPAAIVLAVVLHPVTAALGTLVHALYPMNPGMKDAFEKAISGMPSLTTQLLVIALVAPLCEEIAFRGFMLSGFRHTGRKWMAILLSSIFFGVTHGVLQQSIVACVLGIVIGYITVQAGSLLPAVLYHVTHNGLAVCTGWLRGHFSDMPAVHTLLRDGELLDLQKPPGVVYSWASVVLCGLIALWILRCFSRLRYQRTAEESLQEAIQQQSTQQMPA